MGITEVLDKLATDGVRIEVALEEKTLLRFLLYGCVAAVLSAVTLTLIRKKLPG